MTEGHIFDFEESVADLRNCYKQAFTKAFSEFEIPFDEALLDHYIATPLNEIFEKHYTGCTCKYRDFVIVFMSAFDRVFMDAAEVRPGIVDRLKGLGSEGCKIGIIGEAYSMYIGMFLSKYGIGDCVSAVVGIDQMAVPRPDPYSIKQCLAQMGTTSENTILCSSLPKNTDAAKALGMSVGI